MKTEYKRIMVPVDGSDHSFRAAHQAIGMAKKFGSELILLHCHRSFPGYLGEPLFQTLVTQTLDQANQLIAPYKELFEKFDIPYSAYLMEDPAGKKIAEMAESKTCDLIIMGSRGRTDLKGLIMGSVAHQVLHLTTCPVMIIR